MDEPDPQLIAAARRGDLGAFETIVHRYQADLWRLSFHLVRDESMADDVVQDAFVRVYRFLPRYRGESKFSTWLFALTRNCALDELRRAGRRHKLSRALYYERSPAGPDQSGRIEVREALGALPLDLREPVVLIDMFGASYAEAARVLRVPVGTVKSRVHRARQVLGRALQEPGEERHVEI